MRGATLRTITAPTDNAFQSTLLMRGATIEPLLSFIDPDISIHAPHARSDLYNWLMLIYPHNFNPRSSCEERHEKRNGHTYIKISIHAPHARSDLMVVLTLDGGAISIHAPHARSDAVNQLNAIGKSHFNPRSSCEERRRHMMPGYNGYNFNPRSSCEERLLVFP